MLSLDRPVAHPGADISLAGMTDPRATMLAKANVIDVLGKEGVDLIQWGKAIEGLPQCKLFLDSRIEAHEQLPPPNRK